jgi:hypothetical protein
LTGISVFAFVALKWNAEKSNPDCEDEAKNDHGEDAPAKMQCFAVDIDLRPHERCSSSRAG